MPLTFSKPGERAQIKKIAAKDEMKRHLQNLGFVEGSDVSVIAENGGNVIVCVKDARGAISREMANKIIV